MDSNPNPKRKLTNQQRQAILEALLKQSEDGKLKRGTIVDVAALFSVCTKTVSRIWKSAQSFIANRTMVDVSNNFPGRVGRKRIQIDLSEIPKIPLTRRSNIRTMSIALNVSKSALHRRIKEGMIRPHSNALKPSLTDDNKKARLRFCLSMFNPNSLGGNPTFNNMLTYVHIDEKWFYMSKESQIYYLLPEEDEPLRTCKSKRFITKIMFMAAVARPRYDPIRNEQFSGKIGIFPFTYKEPAKRNSKNRVAGTLETKPILSVTKDVVRACLIEKVLPAIRAKWPLHGTVNTIIIQQDNAKPHIDPNDVEFLQATSSDGFDIRLAFQPPNSPDLNVLDLGFFRAIQSLQHQEAPRTVDELVNAVKKAFDDLSMESLNRIFLTFQQCMIEVMKVYGSNNYKLPHMGKNRLEREGILPSQLECSREIVENVIAHLEL